MTRLIFTSTIYLFWFDFLYVNTKLSIIPLCVCLVNDIISYIPLALVFYLSSMANCFAIIALNRGPHLFRGYKTI